ncbi:MAG: class I SAM-dependent methyltransferase [Pseudomonadota bacterium]
MTAECEKTWPTPHHFPQLAVNQLNNWKNTSCFWLQEFPQFNNQTEAFDSGYSHFLEHNGKQLSVFLKTPSGILHYSSKDLLLAWRKRLIGFTHQKQPLARAIGIQKVKKFKARLLTENKLLIENKPLSYLHVIDATAGLARDAAVIAALGTPVLLIEQNPCVFVLISWAWESIQNDLENWPFKDSTLMQFYWGNAESLIPQLTQQYFTSVVYCDPMFPKRNKSAQVKKESIFLQYVTFNKEDFNWLSLRSYGQRLVIKRPNTVEPWGSPTFQIVGKAVRFDVYENIPVANDLCF